MLQSLTASFGVVLHYARHYGFRKEAIVVSAHIHCHQIWCAECFTIAHLGVQHGHGIVAVARKVLEALHSARRIVCKTPGISANVLSTANGCASLSKRIEVGRVAEREASQGPETAGIRVT